MTDTHSTLTPEQIDAAVQFHGHSCPGLAIGLRAGELAIREVGRAYDEDVVAVVETDMCGVDGIQFLTGCTVGKGNLLLRDFGKMAFSFWRRRDEKGVRLVLRPDALQSRDPEESREDKTRRVLEAPLEQLFEVKEPREPMPGKAPRLASLTCEACGEPTMESRTRRFAGRTLCIPCFEQEDPR